MNLTRLYSTWSAVALLCTVFVLCSDATPAYGASVVGYYPFNGTANDVSGLGNNATPGGNYVYATVAGRSGINTIGDGSLFYAGGGYVQLPDYGSVLNSGLTVSLWVYDKSAAPEIPEMGQYYVAFGIDASNIVGAGSDQTNIGIYASGLSQASPLASNTDTLQRWVMMTFAYAAGQIKGYVNGEPITTDTVSLSVFPTPYACLNRHYFFDGSESAARRDVVYDDLAVYQGALTQSEVRQLYVAQVPEPSTCVMALAGVACGGYSMFRRRKRA